MRSWLYLWLLRFGSSVCIGSVVWKLARSESEGGVWEQQPEIMLALDTAIGSTLKVESKLTSSYFKI